MKYNVILTSAFKEEIHNVDKYIREKLKNPTAASRLMFEAYEIANSLKIFPKRNALLFPDSDIRCIPVKNYLMFYVVREETKTVVIERFLYARQDWESVIK